jgi:hypothetical protein
VPAKFLQMLPEGHLLLGIGIPDFFCGYCFH